MTVSIENFIKAIYKADRLSRKGAKMSTLAEMLKISNAAATDMARKLAARDLVSYKKYKPLTLTAKGNSIALRVIRKHRLWETFLFRTLELSLHEIHREAEDLEHLTSDFLADKIDDFLGNPALDPHGDPIPAVNGKITADKGTLLLSEAQPGNSYTISRLSGSEKEFFDFCDSAELVPGCEIIVERQYPANAMTEIRMKTGKVLMHAAMAHEIHVKQIQNR